jgi:aminoglycoside 6'-N-acetyltransferase I
MPSTLSIRPVAPADAPEWLKLRSELWPDGVEDHEREIVSFFAGTLLEPFAVFVVVNASHQLVGLLELSIRRDVPGLEGNAAGYIEGLYVTPEIRSCGIAWALIETSRSWAREQGCVGFASDRSGRFIVDKRFG